MPEILRFHAEKMMDDQRTKLRFLFLQKWFLICIAGVHVSILFHLCSFDPASFKRPSIFNNFAEKNLFVVTKTNWITIQAAEINPRQFLLALNAILNILCILSHERVQSTGGNFKRIVRNCNQKIFFLQRKTFCCSHFQ